MPDTNWRLFNASVVLVANAHNPSIINVDFLKNNGIIPKSWNAVSGSTLVTPVVTELAFEKIKLNVDLGRFLVEEKLNILKKKCFPSSYTLYECVKKYATVLPHIPYVALGLNWKIELYMQNHQGWFKTQFLKNGEWANKINPILFTFGFPVDDTCVGTLTTGIQNQSIDLNYNFHFDITSGTGKVDKICNILDNQEKYQNILINNLNELFLGGNLSA